MKKIWLLIIVVSLTVIGAIYYYQGNTDRIISALAKNGKIYLGQLKYRVYVLGVLPIVEINFDQPKEEKYKNKDVYYLSAKGEILKIYNSFYNASISLSSYLDKQSLLPLFYEKKVSRFNMKDLVEEVEFDREKNVAFLSGYSHPLFPNTKDPISTFYCFLYNQISPAVPISFNMFTSDRIYTLEGEVKEKLVKVDDKQYQLLIADTKITKKDGNFYRNRVSIKMSIIKISDKENVPILIDIFARGFLLRAKLVEIK